MEEFFDRSGPWGRVMMCSTASVQVCVDAGQEQGGPSGFRWRWHLLHGLGPVLVASFAQLPVPGRADVRLEVNPAGGVVPARSQPDPGPGGSGAGVSRTGAAAGRRTPIRGPRG